MVGSGARGVGGGSVFANQWGIERHDGYDGFPIMACRVLFE